MILDSIFNKIISVTSSGSQYNIYGRRLENYGEVFEAMSPYVLAKYFPKFRECHE